MIGYACLFCFCTGIAMAVYESLNNLVMVFPVILLAIMAYFRHAMKEESARLEPEKLLSNPLIITTTILTGVISVWLLYAQKNEWFNCKDALHIMEAGWEKIHK